MADELIDRIRSLDPLPGGSSAPPFERVYSELASSPRSARRPLSERVRRGLLPALTATVSLAVVAAAVVVILAGTRTQAGAIVSGQRHSGGLRIRGGVPVAPTSGMAGFVDVWGAAFNTAGAGAISLEQCLGCQAQGGDTKRARYQDWLVSTTDGGHRWQLSRRDYYVQRPVLSGQTGWAGGLQMITQSEHDKEHLPAKWEPGEAAALFMHTGNAGRSWTVAPAAAPNEGGTSVSLQGGEAWTVGLSATAVSILHASAGASRLTATASQPIHSDDTNVHVLGAGAGEAYVVDANAPRQAFVTHDDGASWARLPGLPCRGRDAYSDLVAADAQTVWLTCESDSVRQAPALFRSVDGGQSWQKISRDWGADGPEQLTAVSNRDAWAMTQSGDLLRTTDAGSSWVSVWSLTDPQVRRLSGPIPQPGPSQLPILSAQSGDDATVVTLLNRNQATGAAKLTNLVTYRTTDGGRSWQANVVPLGTPGS